MPQGSLAFTQGPVTINAIQAPNVDSTRFDRLCKVPNHGNWRRKSRSSNVPKNAIQHAANGLASPVSNRAASRGAVFRYATTPPGRLTGTNEATSARPTQKKKRPRSKFGGG